MVRQVTSDARSALADRDLPAGPDDARFVSSDDELGAVVRVELGHNPPDVRFRRHRADEQVRGDVSIAHAPGGQCQHFFFAVGEPGQFDRDDRGLDRLPGIGAYQLLGDARRE